MGRYKSIFYAINNGKLPANLLIDPRNRWYLAHYLVMHGKLKELKILVNKFDCDINIVDAYKQTPLHMSVLHYKKDLFKYLVHQPMIILDSFDYMHNSPLLNSIKSGFILAFICLYFEKNCNIKISDSQGYTVAHWAAYKGIVPLLKLFKHIPDINMNMTDIEGMTPIFRAIGGV